LLDIQHQIFKIAAMSLNGLIIGKFYPFHKGHEYLIQKASENCDHLTVLVCSLQREKIDGQLRYQWVKDCFPDVTVIHVTDENPQEPSEHPNFWNIWIDSILRVVSYPIHFVFSSENYGYELARRLHAIHKPIDIDRNIFPISGTMIRSNPYRYRNYLPSSVQKFFTKKIVVYGSESTGKTTTAELLAQHFKTSYAPEFAREYLKDKGLNLNKTDFLNIAKGQIEEEEKASSLSNGVVFYDTDLFTTKIYSNYYIRSCDPYIEQESEKRKYDLYLLMDIDIPWVRDPLRDISEHRQEMHDQFKNQLETKRIIYQTISGNYQTRTRKAIEVVTRFLETMSI
jgi:HTH-type transcriptional regulator, transcriptional repressor of NAD biosynthesis genes